MLPFFFLFENRRPQARELVVIAVLCAIGVAGRAAFFMVPQFKPVAAVVILAGVCFGAESGFLVGAMTAFVSNFFFGQGPWTPWQMFAFGLDRFFWRGCFLKRVACPESAFRCALSARSPSLCSTAASSTSARCSYLPPGPAGRPPPQPTWPPSPFDISHALSTVFSFCADQSHAGKAGTHPQKIRTIARIKAFLRGLLIIRTNILKYF